MDDTRHPVERFVSYGDFGSNLRLVVPKSLRADVLVDPIATYGRTLTINLRNGDTETVNVRPLMTFSFHGSAVSSVLIDALDLRVLWALVPPEAPFTFGVSPQDVLGGQAGSTVNLAPTEVGSGTALTKVTGTINGQGRPVRLFYSFSFATAKVIGGDDAGIGIWDNTSSLWLIKLTAPGVISGTVELKSGDNVQLAYINADSAGHEMAGTLYGLWA